MRSCTIIRRQPEAASSLSRRRLSSTRDSSHGAKRTQIAARFSLTVFGIMEYPSGKGLRGRHVHLGRAFGGVGTHIVRAFHSEEHQSTTPPRKLVAHRMFHIETIYREKCPLTGVEFRSLYPSIHPDCSRVCNILPNQRLPLGG